MILSRAHALSPLALAGAFVIASTVVAACSGSASGPGFGGGPPGGNGPDGSSPPPAGSCQPCTTNTDCTGGAVCAQFQGDSFCALACPNGDECGSGTSCSIETSYAGEQLSVCVPNGNACGSGSGGQDGGSSPPPTPPAPPTPGCGGAPVSCGTLVPPTSASSCTGCTTSTSTKTCQPNGCYGGWWCDSATSKCHSPPTNCAPSTACDGGAPAGDAGPPPPPPPPVDGGAPVSGTVGANGGNVSRLYFTVVGDTRPATPDDTAGYPTSIIGQIYSDIQALSPRPPFSISTGDYQFSSANGTQSATQMNLYMAARAKFSGEFFPALGNHECTGATASNCGQGNTDGVTNNYSNFLSLMLGPIQKTLPYYSINVNATDGSWTSKFVFVAANAWDSTQSSWLSGVMAQATTYTFVIRHEATGTSGPPGVSPSDSIINGFPYTLLIVGHTHTYEHKSTREALFGNGGAPLTGSGNYGFGLISQRSDGALTVDAMDYQTVQPDSSFHFVVTPTGTLTQ